MLGCFASQTGNRHRFQAVFTGLSWSTSGDAANRSFALFYLQNQQFLRRGIPDRRERYAGIESNQPALMPDRESKQINVRQLPRPMNPGRVHDVRIQQTDFIRPEFMHVLAAALSQMRDNSLHRQRIGIGGVRHDANTPILRDRARCPAFLRVLREPIHR
jgi:hypothetical protein